VTTQTVRELLAERKLGYELIRHPPAASASAEAELVGVPLAEVAKTLVLRTPLGYVRAVLPASERLDLHKARRLLGAGKAVALASDDELARDYPEFELGALPPVGGRRVDRVLVDRRLLEHASIVLAAGVRDQSLRLRPADLVLLAGGEVCDLAREERVPGGVAAAAARLREPPALQRLDETLWEIPAETRPDMRVPARVFADRELLDAIAGDLSLVQLENVATLPGIVEAALAMPDIHQGYGFPVGGVAAMRLEDGVVSPGGVGYDINCGVRLLVLPLAAADLGERREPLVHEIARAIPAGTGKRGALVLEGAALDPILVEGPRALVERHGLGTEDDLLHTESDGCLAGADPAAVSERARLRGAGQVGTIGAGNHFIELQAVSRIFDAAAAEAFGLWEGQVTVLIHSGSRGFGHQVCTDYVRLMDRVVGRYDIHLPDRQLACAPISSPEGRAYLAAMAAAANFAWANRHAMAHHVRRAIARVLGEETARATRQVYDVAHNVAKIELHGGRRLCVHRKGATRAFPAGSAEIPADYRGVGQPVFIPGSMGTSSFVLVGLPGSLERSFGTTCHGAGRQLSRTRARKRIGGGELRRQLEERGIVVRCPSNTGLAEEAPFAYKDVERVVDVVERAGLAGRVAQLVPLGVVKG
jgi:tRNA-splicing ligase RtcB